MGARHPLPYAYAKAHTLLLEDDGARLVLWAPENVALPALSEVLRLYEVDGFERESAETLTSRIAAAYAGGESSAACRRTAGSRCASAAARSTCASRRCPRHTASGRCCVCSTRPKANSRSRAWA